MSFEKGLYFIEKLVTYLRSNNYRFELTCKPIIYNFTLQIYSDIVNKKINNAIVLYRDLLNMLELLSMVKQQSKELLNLLPEEHFCVFNIVDNKKYVFKLTRKLLSKIVENSKAKNFQEIFNRLFVTEESIFFNVIDEVINFAENLEDENKTEIILHAKFLEQFLTKNLQKIFLNDVTFLINLFKLSENLKLSYHRLFIDLKCYDIYEFNSVVDLLIELNIDLQDRDLFVIKQDLDRIVANFNDSIEYINYDFEQQSQITLSIILKNSALIKWLLALYLFNTMQHV